MKSTFLLPFSLALFCFASLGEVYVCNLDYYEYLSKYGKDALSQSVTAIFFTEPCAEGKKTSYVDTMGEFRITIFCQTDMHIEVSQGQRVLSDIIDHHNFGQRFFRSYLQGHSGLRISCHQSALATTFTEEQ